MLGMRCIFLSSPFQPRPVTLAAHVAFECVPIGARLWLAFSGLCEVFVSRAVAGLLFL
jgi:hypothetical protein